jgi:hypothetical protein
VLFPPPIAADLAREAVRTETSYARLDTPAAAPPPAHAPAVRRMREVLAGGLHRLAEAVAPAERPRHYGTAH